MNVDRSSVGMLPPDMVACLECGAAIPAAHDRCDDCVGPVTLARPIEDAIRADMTVGGVTLHAGHLATIVTLDRRRGDPVEIITRPLSRAELDRATPFAAAGTLKPGRTAADWPPLARLWVPERALAGWPFSLRRQRWSIAADVHFDPSLVDDEPASWVGFWKRRDALVTAVTVVFIVTMTLMIIATTVGHMGPLSPLSPMSPNG